MKNFSGAILQTLKKRTVQVFLVLFFYLLTAHLLPLSVHQGLYTISLGIKDLLVWILPLTVCFFIAYAICSFKSKAPLFILSLLLFEGVSNFSSVFFAYGGGHLATQFLPKISLSTSGADLMPLMRLPLLKPAWWSADKGTFAGIFLGLCAALFKPPLLTKVITAGKQSAEFILTQFFSRLIPLFILGFVARMAQTNVLQNILTESTSLILWLISLLGAYIALLFIVGGGKESLSHLRNLLPATGIAFSSGCSLSTMPWTIEGTSKNLKNPDFAKAVIPATTNIQQIGDCLTNTFLCFLIYRHFYGVCPDIGLWLHFSLVFVLARFATAAILGGAIFLMIPIYETYLGFNAEMTALIVAFNVILDPLITCTNVLANGALCRIFETVWRGLIFQLEKINPKSQA